MVVWGEDDAKAEEDWCGENWWVRCEQESGGKVGLSKRPMGGAPSMKEYSTIQHS